MLEAAHDMSELDRFMRNFTEIHQGWKDKVMAIIMEKNAILQHLQATTDKIKMMEEWEKINEEENSHLKPKLESRHEASWLRKERDDYALELEEEQKKQKSFEAEAA
ncbi:hypothetical protein COCNU_scaffold003790G000010 [Cocos nucifera]|nr:hypothetical protein [Cocos nucifera]